MSRLIIMGGGISGHTAATYARKWLSEEHEIIVVTPNESWNYVPSNVWVSMGKMKKSDVVVPLEPIYKKFNIVYKQAKVISIHPEGDLDNNKEYISIEYTSKDKEGISEKLEYDYLINATGPKFNYGGTEGLGKENILGNHTVSICTAEDAEKAYRALQVIFTKARNGQKQKVLVGTSHGQSSCQAAALMYLLNIESESVKEKLKDMIEFKYITNESFLGDFGVGGISFKKHGNILSSKELTTSLYKEKNISYIVGAHVYKVESKKIKYELIDGTRHEESFDLAMLFPQFTGTGLIAIDKDGLDITTTLFASNGFMLVDANYKNKLFENWSYDDWPKTYQNPTYKNIFACGTAFAPPHSASKPIISKSGIPIFPGMPRAGMPSSIIGKVVAKSICNLIKYGDNSKLYEASMSNIGSVCFVAAQTGLKHGNAATLTAFPIVPNFKQYPKYGRDFKYVFAEFNLAGYWAKLILHHMLIYKAKLRFGWSKIF